MDSTKSLSNRQNFSGAAGVDVGSVISLQEKRNIEFSYRGYVLSYNAETEFLDLLSKSGSILDYCKIKDRAEVVPVGKRGVDRLLLSHGGCEAFPRRQPIYDHHPKHRPTSNPYEGGWREIMELFSKHCTQMINGETNICTEEEFIADYCKRSRSSWAILKKQYVPLKCVCGAIECRGWAMVSNNERAIKTHNDLYSKESMEGDL